MEQIIEVIKQACEELFGIDVQPELTRPDEQFGDYSTNVALQLAGKLKRNPREVAIAVASKLQKQDGIAEVNIAGPGFINLRLTDQALLELVNKKPAQSYANQTVVAEYSDPNPFKVLHAGHVYTTVVGDAVANLVERSGGNVHRVNYGGDVGLHVGKTIWAIMQKLDGEHPENLQEIPEQQRAEWIADAYVKGNKAYEEDEKSKNEIVTMNKQVYRIYEQNDHNSPFAQIYWTCRDWSYKSFDAFYARLGTKMEKYYPESEVSELGLKTVKEHIGTVFEESDGAVVFRGEQYDLHTRVFINNQGLPTYEAKEVGVIIKKNEDYKFDHSIVITGNEQQQYMAVLQKAIEQFLPDLAAKSIYIPHGMVRLAGDIKMSSRKGNIIRAEDVLNITSKAISATGRGSNDTTILGAVKYAFLKNRIGGDIIYDPAESVALEGNSGPYLQYAHARARNILAKAANVGEKIQSTELDKNERSLARKIGEYAEVVQKATAEFMPHHICTYLYELAQNFNRFYEQSRVIGDQHQEIRLQLVEEYADVLKNGLNLLGITAPDTM